MSDTLPPSHRFVGEIVSPRDKPRVRDLYIDGAEPEPLATEAPGTDVPAPGTIALLERTGEGARLKELLAAPGSARDKLYRIAADHQLNPVFPPAVEAEVEAILAEPLIDDPTLTDLTEVPFVTIDGPGTRDLDQALHIAAAGNGYQVRYALADPARFVRPGTALVVERANQSKLLQKRLTKTANGLVIDQLFADDLRLAADQRPSRLGTVMGLTRSKAHVQLDAPCIEVKIYAHHQREAAGGDVRLSDDAVQWQRDDGTTFCRLGDEVAVQLQRRDERHGRWELSLTPAR